MSLQKLREGGIKGIVLHHIEKAITLVVLGVAGFIFFKGAGIEKIDSEINPAAAWKNAVIASGYINRTDPAYWETLKDQPARNPELDYKDRAKEVKAATDHAPYQVDRVWDNRTQFQLTLRKDPKLHAPLKPETHVDSVAVAMVAPGITNPLDSKRLAVEEEDKKQNRPGKSRPRKPRGDGGDPAGPDGEFGDGAEETSAVDVRSGPRVKTLNSGQLRTLLSHFKHHYQAGGRRLPKDVVPRGTTVVGVTTVVPWLVQYQEFKNVLEAAVGFSPERDSPKYINFEAQVADVTADPNMAIADMEWKLISNSRFASVTQPKMWHDPAAEVVNPDYISKGDETTLTMPIPPFLFCDYGPFATDPRIPDKTEEADKGKDEDKTEEEKTPMDVFSDPMAEGVLGVVKDKPKAKKEKVAKDDKLEPKVPYKLVRFFHFSAEPGKMYRYRIRVFLEDPNNPQKAALEDELLDDSVIDRVKQVSVRDQKISKARGVDFRTYWRITDWSEPSDIVRISSVPSEMLAGPAEAAGARTGKRGKITVAAWDKRYGVKVPLEQSVQVGSVLNATADADVLHPAQLDIRRLEKYSLRTDAIVLDIRGGDPLPRAKFNHMEKIFSPGEYLIMDADGQLRVQNEFEDMAAYNMRLLRIEAKGGNTGGGDPNWTNAIEQAKRRAGELEGYGN